MERTVIMYHGDCPDGFGGAYAAWKKYGDSAEYIPLNRGGSIPEGIDGADVYMLDYTFNTIEEMKETERRAASLTVIDHHEGIRSITEAMPNHVYDADHSGAVLSWNYFHPGVEVPRLLAYVEDDDIFRFALPETKPFMTYLIIQPLDFEGWDEISRKLENDEERAAILEKASAYRDYFEYLAEQAIDKAKLVSFEGYEVYFANAHPHKTMKSLIGHRLAAKKGPLALVVSAHPKGYGVSIRGDGSVDVAAIAAKFGGNGHTSSAGFAMPREGPFPWELIENDEDTRD